MNIKLENVPGGLSAGFSVEIVEIKEEVGGEGLSEIKTDPDPHTCPKCEEIFQQESRYTDHVLTHSPWHVLYVCDLCGVTVEQRDLLASHILSHLIQADSTAENNADFSDADSEDIPLVPPKDPFGEFACDQCPASFNKKYFLRKHRQLHELKKARLEEEVTKSVTRKRRAVTEVFYKYSNDDADYNGLPPEDEGMLLNPASLTIVKHKKRKPRGETAVIKESKIYKCEFCEEVFDRKGERRSHENEKHKEEVANRSPVIRCEICGILCKRNSFKGHMRIHTGERPFQCLQCGKSFTHQGSLSQHKKVHSEKGYTCEICHKAYSRATHLKSHMWVHSGQKSYICSTCGKTFAQSCTLKVHMKLHSGEKPYSCTVCGKAFSKQWGLVAHHIVHSREKRFVCEKCGEEFARKVSLKFHILKWHTDEDSALLNKNHICDTCGKPFFTKAELQQHLIVHSGVKPFICGVCGKTFARQSGLVLHTRTHTGEKPYVCKVCHKAFACKSTLNTHRVIHTGEKPYSCQTCGKSFKFRVTLSEHVQLHSGEKPFPCVVCGKEFALSKYLQAHMSKHKEERPHVCQVCTRSFYSKTDLKKHYDSTHT